MKQLLVLFLLGLFPILKAQNETFEDPSTGDAGQNFARVTYTDEGNLWLDNDGSFQLDRNLAVTAGGSIKTEYRSVAEVELIDGSLIQISGDAFVEFQAINDVFNQESVTVINLKDGSLFLHITSSPEWLKKRVYRIDSAHGSIYLEMPGLYRVDQKSYQTKLYVYRGIGEIAGEKDSQLVRSGEYSAVTNFNFPYQAKPFNSYYKDSFTSWAFSRLPAQLGASARYVAPEIQRYSYALDSGGSWRYSVELGTQVWVPNVPTTWRPYYNGYWSQCGVSLSWIGYEDWSWITGHYGRWGWDLGFGWYWIPDRFYAPAWVAWTVLDGLLGWCPLGRWNYPWYYNRHHHYNSVVINNFNNTWIYSNPDRLHVRNGEHYRAIPRGTKTDVRYSTRAIHVNRETRSNPGRYTQTVLNPRSKAPVSRVTTTSNRVYETRSSHTRASSRYVTDERNGSITRTNQGRATTRVEPISRANTSSSTRANSSRVNSDRVNSDRVTSRIGSSNSEQSSRTAPERSKSDNTNRAREPRTKTESPRTTEKSNTSRERGSSPSTAYRVPTDPAPKTPEKQAPQRYSPTREKSSSEPSSRSSRESSSPRTSYSVPKSSSSSSSSPRSTYSPSKPTRSSSSTPSRSSSTSRAPRHSSSSGTRTSRPSSSSNSGKSNSSSSSRSSSSRKRG